MAIALDTLQQRIIGVLIEKELTVPDGYPLTLNALLAGCNQKNNRDPQMNVEDFDVEGAVRSLMDIDWVARREPDGGRVHRFAHNAGTQLGVEKADLAILSELLCRGPQAPGALKTRASRMHAFDSPAAVKERLRAMAARPVPYVVELPKRPREQQPRWRHLLDGLSPEDALAQAPEVSTTETAPATSAAPATPGLADRVADLEARVAALEARLGRDDATE